MTAQLLPRLPASTAALCGAPTLAGPAVGGSRPHPFGVKPHCRLQVPCPVLQARWGLVPERGAVRCASQKGAKGAPAKVALVGKKLQLKPPAPRPDLRQQQQPPAEAGQAEGPVGESGPAVDAARQQERQQGSEASARLAQPQERAQSLQQEEAADPSQAEAAARKTSGAEARQKEATPEEQAAELQALRKAVAGQGGGKGVRSSSALYAGVLEEIGHINWPALPQVGGTTLLVMAMLTGAAAALTALNYALSEATKATFEEGPVRDALRRVLHL